MHLGYSITQDISHIFQLNKIENKFMEISLNVNCNNPSVLCLHVYGSSGILTQTVLQISSLESFSEEHVVEFGYKLKHSLK